MTQTALAPSPDAATTASQILGDPAKPAEPKDDTLPPDDRVSPKLHILARREKTAIDRERAAKTKEAELDAKIEAFRARESRVSEFERLKETNPLEALKLLGLSYQDLTQIQLADGNVTPDVQVKKLDERLNSFITNQEAALGREKDEAEKRTVAQEQRALDTFKTEITTHLKENGDRYELIAFEQAEGLVYDVIDEHYARTINAETGIGEVMPINQAADKVEEHLEKKYQKAPDLKKVSAFLSSRTAKAAPKLNTPPRQTPKTLNNNLSATSTPKRTARVTDDERIARAISYARGLRP